jgi:hypothetical protein
MIVPILMAEELRSSLSDQVFMAIFDDDETGDVGITEQSSAVNDVLQDANVWVISRLPAIYVTIPDGSDAGYSDLLKSAVRLYAKYLAFGRRPEYTRSIGRTRSQQDAKSTADNLMNQIQAGILRIAPRDNPPEMSPRNVGGFVLSTTQRAMLPNVDGASNSGDF